eukprot:scaffold80206_cov27-Tisochrysis_lutea.AAC.1
MRAGKPGSRRPPPLIRRLMARRGAPPSSRHSASQPVPRLSQKRTVGHSPSPGGRVPCFSLGGSDPLVKYYNTSETDLLAVSSFPSDPFAVKKPQEGPDIEINEVPHYETWARS